MREEQARDRDEVGRRGQGRGAELLGAHRSGQDQRLGVAVGAFGAGDAHGVRTCPTARCVGHDDDAVDLGGLAVAAGDAGGVHEHFDLGADQIVTSGGGDGVLALAQLGQPLVARAAAATDAVEVGGVGAVLARVGEEPAPVELGVVDEGEQLVVVGLGLARVARR